MQQPATNHHPHCAGSNWCEVQRPRESGMGQPELLLFVARSPSVAAERPKRRASLSSSAVDTAPLNHGLQCARILACSGGGGSGGGPAPKQESSVKKFFVSGAVATIYECFCGHQLEFLKILKQTKPGSYVDLLKGVVGQKGVVGLWDGFFPWGTIQAIAKGAVFGGAHSFAQAQLRPYVEDKTLSPMMAETVAGGIGGGFQGLVLSPTLLLKTRVMTDPVFRQNMSLGQTSKESARVGMRVIRNEGVAALMKGSVTFSLKRVADWGTRFYFSVLTEDLLFKKGDPTYKLTNGDKLAASLIGGVMSSLLTLPLDVMVAQIQQASKAGQKVSIVQTFAAEFKAGGWERVAGFATKGFVARTAHVALTTALMKTMTGVVYDWIYGEEKKA